MNKRQQLDTLLNVTLPEIVAAQQWGQVMDGISTALNIAWNSPSVDPTEGYFRNAMLRARALASSGAVAGMWMSNEDARDLEHALHGSLEDASDILMEG
tara:strand:+ start:110 stop:406 length:297 start_codon:yes stop_codon:yes gene_type:complete